MEIELHAHTHHSRGSKITVEVLMSPTELVRQAKRIRLDAVAVTDHSTGAGWTEALQAGKKHGVTVIPGIEINTEEGHLIGLGLNEHVPFLIHRLSSEVVHHMVLINIGGKDMVGCALKGNGVEGHGGLVDFCSIVNAASS